MSAPVRFAVVSGAWNCAPWVARSLESIRRQTHREFRCVLIDDASTDGTFERAQAAVAGDSRFELIRNPQRLSLLPNLKEATRRAAPAETDVVVVVDADDWLKHDRVFEHLARLYADPALWLTWGSSELLRRPLKARLLGRRPRGISAPFPDVIAQGGLYRYYKFVAGHLRTYRRFLWDGIRDEHLRDEQGNYFRTAGDAVTMWPMLEMATPRHFRFIPEVLYVYNNGHGLNDNRPDAVNQQILATALTRSRGRYPPLAR